jgi:hypothetical protein
VICPLCGTRRARRACPALGKQICTVCCGTKRLVEIRCPGDCPYLASAREHPPAATVRQQQRDVGVLMHATRDLNTRQSQLFLLIATFMVRYEAPELQAVIDEDVGEAAAALAATFETASRGVIYEHRPKSLTAERLNIALKPLLAEAGKGRGSAFERDAALVLRRLEEAVRDMRTVDAGNRRALLDVLARVMRDTAEAPPAPAVADRPSLIIP